jgi:hypothetical protein
LRNEYSISEKELPALVTFHGKSHKGVIMFPSQKFVEEDLRMFLDSVANGSHAPEEYGDVRILNRDCEEYRSQMPGADPKKKGKKRRLSSSVDDTEEDL